MGPWPTLALEHGLLAKGFRRIAGLDEAGRGAWAGPVVAAAVILPAEAAVRGVFQGIRDSKLLSAYQREKLFDVIREGAEAVGVGGVAPEEIDAWGIVPATRRAMALAVQGLGMAPQYLLIDYLRLPEVDIPQYALAHGDALCLSIAAASVVAKVHRDRLMAALDVRWPDYGFARHKGYGTVAHRGVLASLGPSSIHRLSWSPCREAK